MTKSADIATDGPKVENTGTMLDTKLKQRVEDLQTAGETYRVMAIGSRDGVGSNGLDNWNGGKGVLNRWFRLVCAVPFGFTDVECEIDREWSETQTTLSPAAYARDQGWRYSRTYGWLCPSCSERLKKKTS